MSQIQYEMKTKIGYLYLVASMNGLQGVFFRKQPGSMVKDFSGSNPEVKILSKTAQQLEEYFEGQRADFDIPLDLSGTAFQKQVWKELARIPFGKTVAYKDIARLIKNPKAVRAVGSANGKNPVCIIIPCHRVIAADGSLGGYSSGIHNKRKLLKLEGVDNINED